MKNQGISLISLIITIIVIIILAAIVIFTGLNTPDSAQFSAFCNDVDSVYTAVMNKYGDLKADHAIRGHYRTNEQIYIEVATGNDPGQYDVMGTDDVISGDAQIASGSTHCQNIVPDTTRTGADQVKLGLTLPKVRQSNTAWYVMDDGRIFNETGYLYNGNTYWNAAYYTKGERVTTHNEARATAIAAHIYGSSEAFEVPASSLPAES